MTAPADPFESWFSPADELTADLDAARTQAFIRGTITQDQFDAMKSVHTPVPPDDSAADAP